MSYRIDQICNEFGISRQGYYKARNQQQKTEDDHTKLIQKVLALRKQMPMLGGRKLYVLLKGEIESLSAPLGRDKFFELLKQNHLLIKQKNERGIEKFMRSLATRYAQYFNHRHDKRVGGLFQDTYKAVLVETEEQLLHLTRYIHRNPIQKGLTLKECPQPSSYPNYLGRINQEWVKPQDILGYFAAAGTNSYESFVEDQRLEEASISVIQNSVIDL